MKETKLLKLKDNNIEGCVKEKRQDNAAHMKAIDQLTEMLVNMDKNDSIFWLGFKGNKKNNPPMEKKNLDAPVSYKIEEVHDVHGNATPSKVCFYTSGYIGHFETSISEKNKGAIHDVCLIIEPRFGSALCNYLIEYATGLFCIRQAAGTSPSTHGLWLLALLWRAALEQALISAHIPRIYQTTNKNLRAVRGRINVNHDIRFNISDRSRVYCRYRSLSYSTPINRTVRYVYRLLERKGYPGNLTGLHEYDTRLASLGVPNEPIALSEIQYLYFDALTKPWKQVMRLSAAIISGTGYQAQLSGSRSGFGYFLDMNELWELYLLRILQRHLPSDYRVYSPNQTGDVDFLDNGRRIRPDIIIERNSMVVAVLDAKYKRYCRIGRKSNEPYAVSREDVYQMAAYMLHYGTKARNTIIGLFVSPFSCDKKYYDDNLINLKNSSHKLMVIVHDVEKFSKESDVELNQPDINDSERYFVKKVIDSLQSQN